METSAKPHIDSEAINITHWLSIVFLSVKRLLQRSHSTNRCPVNDLYLFVKRMSAWPFFAQGIGQQNLERITSVSYDKGTKNIWERQIVWRVLQRSRIIGQSYIKKCIFRARVKRIRETIKQNSTNKRISEHKRMKSQSK